MRPDPKTTVLLSYLSFLLSSFSHSAASSFEEQFRNQSFKEQKSTAYAVTQRASGFFPGTLAAFTGVFTAAPFGCGREKLTDQNKGATPFLKKLSACEPRLHFNF
jgi:hypothetical protein